MSLSLLYDSKLKITKVKAVLPVSLEEAFVGIVKAKNNNVTTEELDELESLFSANLKVRFKKAGLPIPEQWTLSELEKLKSKRELVTSIKSKKEWCEYVTKCHARYVNIIGNPENGLERWRLMEFMAALDLGHVMYGDVPLDLKHKINLPRMDKGVDTVGLVFECNNLVCYDVGQVKYGKRKQLTYVHMAGIPFVRTLSRNNKSNVIPLRKAYLVVPDNWISPSADFGVYLKGIALALDVRMLNLDQEIELLLTSKRLEVNNPTAVSGSLQYEVRKWIVDNKEIILNILDNRKTGPNPTNMKELVIQSLRVCVSTGGGKTGLPFVVASCRPEDTFDVIVHSQEMVEQYRRMLPRYSNSLGLTEDDVSFGVIGEQRRVRVFSVSQMHNLPPREHMHTMIDECDKYDTTIMADEDTRHTFRSSMVKHAAKSLKSCSLFSATAEWADDIAPDINVTKMELSEYSNIHIPVMALNIINTSDVDLMAVGLEELKKWQSMKLGVMLVKLSTNRECVVFRDMINADITLGRAVVYNSDSTQPQWTPGDLSFRFVITCVRGSVGLDQGCITGVTVIGNITSRRLLQQTLGRADRCSCDEVEAYIITSNISQTAKIVGGVLASWYGHSNAVGSISELPSYLLNVRDVSVGVGVCADVEISTGVTVRDRFVASADKSFKSLMSDMKRLMKVISKTKKTAKKTKRKREEEEDCTDLDFMVPVDDERKQIMAKDIQNNNPADVLALIKHKPSIILRSANNPEKYSIAWKGRTIEVTIRRSLTPEIWKEVKEQDERNRVLEYVIPREASALVFQKDGMAAGLKSRREQMPRVLPVAKGAGKTIENIAVKIGDPVLSARVSSVVDAEVKMGMCFNSITCNNRPGGLDIKMQKYIRDWYKAEKKEKKPTMGTIENLIACKTADDINSRPGQQSFHSHLGNPDYLHAGIYKQRIKMLETHFDWINDIHAPICGRAAECMLCGGPADSAPLIPEEQRKRMIAKNKQLSIDHAAEKVKRMKARQERLAVK